MTSEFQAVVLAGGSGSRMLDLTQKKPKCFLPIGNYPMVWYSLRLLQSIGFKEVIVVTQDKFREEMSTIPRKYGLALQMDIVTFSAQDDPGTADALRLVLPKLVAENVMVVSSDLIVDANQIRHLTDLHRLHRASLTALFAPVAESKQVQVPGPKTKLKLEKDLVAIDKSNSQICFLSSEADLGEVISVRKNLLHEHPDITIYSNLLDAHFYIFGRNIVDSIINEKDYATIKGEVLPQIVRKQFKTGKNSKDETVGDDDTSRLKQDDVIKDDPLGNLIQEAQELSSWNDHTGDLRGAYRNRPIRCYAYVMDRGTTCIRANNLVSYVEANRQIEQLWPTILDRELVLINPTAHIGTRAVVGNECFIGEKSFISDKTTIKDCVIGSHCKIEEKVRLTNCIIMDKVEIKSGSSIQGSLICDGAIVQEKCDIRNSIIGGGQMVGPEVKVSNEVFTSEEDDLYEC